MKKINIKWTIERLIKTYKAIEFPEFQREPTVWDLDKKRKLIDSILRDFDIASIYLFKRPDGIYECIDGRQRINAIISFLGLNEDNQDNLSGDNNNFKFISSDELLGSDLLKDYDNKTWEQFNPLQKTKILQYQFNVIEITDFDNNDYELNLMFLRLQLGAPLNAGEKLNAMVGDMKDFIFKKLGKNKYILFLNIPKRRFAKELIAAQIAINFFSLNETKNHERARFIDLQEFFKEHLKFSPNDKETVDLLEKRLNDVYQHVSTTSSLNLKNKAIGLSVFFFIDYLILNHKESQIKQFIKFLNEFLKRLKTQVAKGIDIDKEYRDLLKFQNYISQAAVEKYAIENRQKFLEDYFNYYLHYEKIKGDK